MLAATSIPVLRPKVDSATRQQKLRQLYSFADRTRPPQQRCMCARLSDIMGNRVPKQNLREALGRATSGLGMNVLLQAAAGVGSTTVVRCLAKDLGLRLCKIENNGGSLRAHLR